MTTISLAPPLRGRCPDIAQSAVSEPAGFGRSTRVRTLMGWQTVDRLMAGDLVIDTAGNLHELRGVRQIQVAGSAVVRIARTGSAPLVVGAGQTLIAEDWRTQVVFGQSATCMAARMVDGVRLRRGQPRGAVLYHLLVDSPVRLDIGAAQAVLGPLA